MYSSSVDTSRKTMSGQRYERFPENTSIANMTGGAVPRSHAAKRQRGISASARGPQI
ncbi:predicted protein [Sclerotinia sclerotiorum 1980 UF-70]|uniref:Uncharacterized protein n=1 Tax=Sclerotinia sclerotiorum (strain ATCC 18683 / 1980 / Ss-1) TaxID=665079 RepID=A7EEU7_SCLS1|nr:predicted protein [Sclerotinia sclerotiorum 1980 UF-70]EDO01363.1 predicted protein [Sclerotinia sclerotiorum 1980 UF-70]